jgi:hypothetical protein
MRHPDQAALALHAGGDLGAFARWRMERHLANCARCRKEVSAFRSLRSSVADLASLPELPWNPMALEMRANIRLGISAGECVRPTQSAPAFRFGWRPMVALTSIAALAITGIILEHPLNRLERRELAAQDSVLQTSADGVGSQSLRLMYRGARDVQLTASAAGSVEAHYTDPKTSYMTVSEVDAQ